jgi:uncharacterized damage-inducible protein DinB
MDRTRGRAGELLEYLRRYRLTMEMKCADLGAAQLANRSVPPSTMSLLGLIRHMADVERHWFRRVLAQSDAPFLYWSEDVPDAEWLGVAADPAVVDDAWRAWRGEVAFAEKFVADSPDLGVKGFEPDGSSPALRSVLVHMIEEYARHCGHADLLRERIDGRIGQWQRFRFRVSRPPQEAACKPGQDSRSAASTAWQVCSTVSRSQSITACGCLSAEN